MLSCLLTHEKIIFLAALRKDIHVIRELKIKVFRHFLQTMNVKKSHDQSLPVRFARLSRHLRPFVSNTSPKCNKLTDRVWKDAVQGLGKADG